MEVETIGGLLWRFWATTQGPLNIPALFGVLIPFVVKFQRDLCVEADAKIIIHDASFGELSESSRWGRGNCSEMS